MSKSRRGKLRRTTTLAGLMFRSDKFKCRPPGTLVEAIDCGKPMRRIKWAITTVRLGDIR